MNQMLINNILREKIRKASLQTSVKELGRIIKVGDGIISVGGIPNSFLSETIEDTNGFLGVVLNLRKEGVEVLVLSGFENLKEGSEVTATGKFLEVPTGEKLIGRVIDPLGNPVDGGELINSTVKYPVERRAYGIVERQPVNRPLQTGIKSIDSMTPIGRGQRELIIGDRQTGKTALAVDTIINQINNSEENKVICFYIAIGQKESKVAKIVAKLKETGALQHTVVVVAGASDPVSWQYIAPYSGVAMAEFFLDSGKDALVVYDDLSKHAWAYREISLVLRRPPGREAYPGDIFFLHSKLLERSCQLSDSLGGGSLTALPIIETQAGDVSSYIPTNVISITDGQIYLDRELFNSGFRPAVNIGLSVSRVGGKAQVTIMKQLTGKLRLELAQYRELSAFSQFAADLDSSTREKLEQGDKTMESLKQDQYKPLKLEEQIVFFYIITHGYLKDITVNEVMQFTEDLLAYINTSKPEILRALNKELLLSETLITKIDEVINEFKITRNYGHS